MIKISKLSKSYLQGSRKIEVLKNLCFNGSAQKTYGVVGQSGSGKSTLLHLIAGLDDFDSGSIDIFGKKLENMSNNKKAAYRRRHLSIVFQEFHLIEHLTAVENIKLALDISSFDKKNIEQVAWSSLKQVGLDHRAKHFPSQLSGGEKQRVSIARAFATLPDLIIADEPSGHLDADSAALVIDYLWKLIDIHKMTMILATHNSLLASKCDQIYLLSNGQLHDHQLKI